MELIVKKCIEIINLNKNFINFNDLKKQLEIQNVSYNEQKLLKRLTNTNQLEVKNENGQYIFKINNPAIQKEISNERRLGLFFSGQENTVIRNVYEVIYYSGIQGVSYTQLMEKYQQQFRDKLDIKQSSHQCKRLEKLNFVDIQNQTDAKLNVQNKVVRAIIFVQREISLKKKINHNNQNTGYGNATDQNDQYNLMLQSFVERQIENNPLKQIQSKTYLFRELNLKENIMLNVSSQEAQEKGGILKIELQERVAKESQIKQLLRIFDKLLSIYQIEQIPVRQGKKFSIKYLAKLSKTNIQVISNSNSIINNGKNLDYQQNNKLQFQESYSQNQKLKSSLNFDDESQFQMVKIKPLFDLESMNDNLVKQMNQSIGQIKNKKEMNDQQKKDETLNFDSFEFILKFAKQQPEFNNFLINENQAKSINQNFSLIQEINQITDETKFFQIQHYKEVSDFLLKFIIETYENQLKDVQNKSKHMSKRQATQSKIKRYLLIINFVQEKEVEDFLLIKKYIIDNEKDQGIGSIDRKTLKYIINALSSIKLFQIKYKTFHSDVQRDKHFERELVIYHKTTCDSQKIESAYDKMKAGYQEKKIKFEEDTESIIDFENFQDSNSQFKRESDRLKRKRHEQSNKNNIYGGINGHKKIKKNQIIDDFDVDVDGGDDKDNNSESGEIQIYYDSSNSVVVQEEQTNNQSKDKEIERYMQRAKKVNTKAMKITCLILFLESLRKGQQQKYLKWAFNNLKPDLSQILTKELFLKNVDSKNHLFCSGDSKLLNFDLKLLEFNDQSVFQQSLKSQQAFNKFIVSEQNVEEITYEHSLNFISEFQQNQVHVVGLINEGINKLNNQRDQTESLLYENSHLNSYNKDQLEEELKLSNKCGSEQNREEIENQFLETYQEQLLKIQNLKQVQTKNREPITEIKFQSKQERIKRFLLKNPIQKVKNILIKFPGIDLYTMIQSLVLDDAVILHEQFQDIQKFKTIDFSQFVQLLNQSNIENVYYEIKQSYIEYFSLDC